MELKERRPIVEQLRQIIQKYSHIDVSAKQLQDNFFKSILPSVRTKELVRDQTYFHFHVIMMEKSMLLMKETRNEVIELLNLEFKRIQQELKRQFPGEASLVTRYLVKDLITEFVNAGLPESSIQSMSLSSLQPSVFYNNQSLKESFSEDFQVDDADL